MAATTLALGSASYQLLDALVTTSPNNAPATGTTATLSAKQRGGVIGSVVGGEKLDITVPFGTAAHQVTAFNVSSVSDGVTVRDADWNVVGGTTGSNAAINFLANASNAQVLLGGGDNRFNASRDFVGSTINAGGGNDSIRIGGAATGSLVNTGGGNDTLIVGRTSTDFDANLGAGDDSAMFLGALVAGADTTMPWDASMHGQSSVSSIPSTSPTTGMSMQGQSPVPFSYPTEPGMGTSMPGQSLAPRAYANIINMGEGNDTASFKGGVTGKYELQMGGGADTTVFGANSLSSGFLLDTGAGSDSTVLGWQTSNAKIQLGSGAFSDTLVLGLGADITNSTITSYQSSGDRLSFDGDLMSVGILLGTGQDSINLTGTAEFAGTFDSWSLGAGNDTVTLNDGSDVFGPGLISLGAGADSMLLRNIGDGFMIDLGIDSSTDLIEFAESTSGSDFGYTGLTINNFGRQDILIIGNDSLTYSGLTSYMSNSYSPDNDASVWGSFFSSGNRVNRIVS